MRRSVRAALGVTLIASSLVGYLALDVFDQVPGVLTWVPEPTAPVAKPSATPHVSVPIPTPTTGMPLRPAGADAPAPTAAGLSAALNPVLSAGALGPDPAVIVRDAVNGAHLVDLRADSPRAPASTLKLLAAVGVLRGLGPATTLQTRVIAGVTRDRILLVPGGDSLLEPGVGRPDEVAGHAGLTDLASRTATALKAAGVPAVTLAVDRSYAEGPSSAPTWPASFLATGITGPVAMAGLSTQRAIPGRPGPADPVGEVLSAFAARLREQGVAVTLAPQPLPAETGLAPRRHPRAIAVDHDRRTGRGDHSGLGELGASSRPARPRAARERQRSHRNPGPRGGLPGHGRAGFRWRRGIPHLASPSAGTGRHRHDPLRRIGTDPRQSVAGPTAR
ncbi:MAG: D-alanyl-D-alanine carboxypeptidase [Actinomycetales bacterium]|nr:D-alanyl-D-alanine carboxypeptidase [Actinomycetales bacterium]